jgi:hypothetical protein
VESDEFDQRPIWLDVTKRKTVSHCKGLRLTSVGLIPKPQSLGQLERRVLGVRAGIHPN